jgi:hypothetical protein
LKVLVVALLILSFDTIKGCCVNEMLKRVQQDSISIYDLRFTIYDLGFTIWDLGLFVFLRNPTFIFFAHNFFCKCYFLKEYLLNFVLL